MLVDAQISQSKQAFGGKHAQMLISEMALKNYEGFVGSCLNKQLKLSAYVIIAYHISVCIGYFYN